MSEETKIQGAELASMLKSALNDGLDAPWLKQSDENMAVWREAKLGFFFHWGLYSLIGRGEWAMYNDKIPTEKYARLADQFQPKRFDAKEWAALAKEAGMRYSVMVTRHHDGFALWDSPGSHERFHSMNSAARWDFVKEYTDTFREEGFLTGLYYSLMDWRFPGYFKPKELPENAVLMKKQTYDQIKELVTSYGKIDIIWYDGGWLAHTGSDADAAWLWEPIPLNQMIREYQPHCLMNPRSGWSGDFQCEEGSHDVIGEIRHSYWEKCFTLGGYWSYSKDEKGMSYERAIELMVDSFVRGGNVLLNVTPTPDGEIPVNQVEILKKIGTFMRTNGESIYGTKAGPFQPVDHVYGATWKGKLVYLHVRDMFAFDKMQLPPLPQKIVSCRLLDGAPVSFEQREEGISIRVPREAWDDLDTIIQLDLENEASL